MNEEKKKRGRPPLSPEEKENRRVAKIANVAAYHKKTGYAAQNKYKKSNPEKYREYNRRSREKVYEPKIRLPLSKKETLQDLLKAEGLSLTQLFAVLVSKEYGIDLTGGDSE